MPYIRLRIARCLEAKTAKPLCQRAGHEMITKLTKEDKAEYLTGKIPSIGLEVEVMDETPIQKRGQLDFLKTAFFGIQPGGDEQWEFSTSPTSPGIQARYISELIAGDFFERDLLEHGQYSMHVNLGIPDSFTLTDEKASYFAQVMIAAYGDKERIESGNYGTPFFIQMFNAEPDPSAHKVSRSEVHGVHYHGRLELRAFSVEHDTIYRLIHDVPILASAWYASEKQNLDETDRMLKEIWNSLNERIQVILSKNHIEFAKEPSVSDLEIPLFLQEEIKPLVRESARKIRQVLGTRTSKQDLKQAA